MRDHGLRRAMNQTLDEAVAIRLEQLAEEAGVNYTLLGRCLLSLAVGLQPVLEAGKGRNLQELKRAHDFLLNRWPAVAADFAALKHFRVPAKPSPYDITQNEKHPHII